LCEHREIFLPLLLLILTAIELSLGGSNVTRWQ